jgi:hypothetical protein
LPSVADPLQTDGWDFLDVRNLLKLLQLREVRLVKQVCADVEL